MSALTIGPSTPPQIPRRLRAAAAEFGLRPAVISAERTLSWNQLLDEATAFAAFLQESGVRKGDVVAWQLPNWWEALVVAHGIWIAGAASAPAVPLFRAHEMAQVLAKTQPTCVVTAGQIRRTSHVDVFEDALRQEGVRPSVRVVVRGSAPGWTPFEQTLRAGAAVVSETPEAALIAFTSGTTSGAKGVVHSSATFLSVADAMVPACGMRYDDVGYLSAPLAHAAGLVWGVGIPMASGAAVVLRDTWEPEAALKDFQVHSVTYSTGPALFLSELLDAMKRHGVAKLPLRTGFPTGGSGLPDSIIESADEVGLRPLRGYGMTECPMTAITRPFDPAAKRRYTDGRASSGSELKVVSSDGAEMARGDEGEILARGPQRAVRYLDATDDEAFLDGGWFRTGDLGRLDESGFVRVTGRLKDIINRGGEKFSALEIESLLAAHPDVAEVAVTAVPHDRFGEQPAAFVVLRGTSPLDAAALQQFLSARHLAKQKIPQIWHVMDRLPRTASGKVVKRQLLE